MQLKLTGRHFEITPTLKAHVTERFDRLSKYNAHILEGEVVLFRDHVNDIAEGKIHLGHTVFAAKGEAADMFGAVGDLVDKLLIQLQRHEGRLRDRKRHLPGE